MEKKYDDLKMKKILFTYKQYAYDDCDTLMVDDMMSEKEKIELELDAIDERRRVESDLIGVGGNVPLYDFDYDEVDELFVGEDSAFLELQEYEEVDKGVMIRFYLSEEDLKNDSYFGNVILDTKFTLNANTESEKKVIRAILREFGIGSFGNKATEKKRSIMFNIPADIEEDRRRHKNPLNEKGKCKIKD